MNKWLAYVLGIITGIVLTFSFAYCVDQHKKSGIDGLEMLENPEEDMGYSMLKVFQVIDSGYALARADGHYDSTVLFGDAIALEVIDSSSGIVLTSDLKVLILSQEGSNFYDKQIVKAPRGKCARQIGTYKYSEYGITKIIPVIAFK